MPKAKQTEENVLDSTTSDTQPSSIPVSRKDVTPLSPDQMEMVNEMIANAMKVGKESGGAVSVYNIRDPKSIKTVKVKRIMGKFVIGFKNLQDDPFKTNALYIAYKPDMIRKLDRQPWITLILSDGKNEEEKELLLSDYYHNRDFYEADVLDIEVTDIVESHGVLGSRGMYAGTVDENGNVMSAPKIKAETKRQEKVFIVKLPGFDKPVRFISDYLA